MRENPLAAGGAQQNKDYYEIMRRCVTCDKLCVSVLGSMMMGIGYRKKQIELLIFVFYTFREWSIVLLS